MMKKFTIYYLLLTIALCNTTPAETGIIYSLNVGEVSGKISGRTDTEKYYSSCRILENMYCKPWGGVAKRPGTYYVTSIMIPEIPEVPEVPMTYNFTYISEPGGVVWGIPVGDIEMFTSFDVDGVARNVGGGVVGLPYTGHPFVAGELVTITNTTNYNDTYTLGEGTSENELQITSSYAAETFDGTEVVCKRVQSMKVGSSRMVIDSEGNLYYGHIWTAASLTYVTKVEPDSTKVFDFLNSSEVWPLYSSQDWTGGLAITDDDKYLYIWIIIDYATDWGYLEKWDLTTGDREWRSDGLTWPGADMDIDAEGNAYADGGGALQKFASADGSATELESDVSTYEVLVSDSLGIVICGGRTIIGDGPNLWVQKLDESGGDSMEVGGDGLEFIGQTGIAVHDDIIYVLVSALKTLYKIGWDGTELSLIDSADGPDYGQGIYFDLYDNLVVVNNEFLDEQEDCLWFYDTNLSYLGKLSGMPSIGSQWSQSYYSRGSIVFGGDLGTPGIPGTPAHPVTGDDDYNPLRLLTFEVPNSRSYILVLGDKTIQFCDGK